VLSIAYGWHSYCATAGKDADSKSMLKIQRSEDGEFVVFTLSGRIKMERLADLQRLFESEAKDKRIVLDLKEVKLVDQEVVRFLGHCEVDGIKLENCPAYIREWISREQRQRQTNRIKESKHE
jgi:hypothetical protein